MQPKIQQQLKTANLVRQAPTTEGDASAAQLPFAD